MMDWKALIIIILIGVMLLTSLVGLLIALFNGDMKKFVVEKMAEAEKLFPKEVPDYQQKRRSYVIEAFKDRYQIMQFLLNVEKFIELVIKYSKEINYKK